MCMSFHIDFKIFMNYILRVRQMPLTRDISVKSLMTTPAASSEPLIDINGMYPAGALSGLMRFPA